MTRSRSAAAGPQREAASQPPSPQHDDGREDVPLWRATEFVLEEARMVLPGMQALFGFQLIAVFTPGFDEKLVPGDRQLHLVATGLVVLAIGLIMTPAAYHRQRGTHRVSERFLRLSSRLLLWSLAVLALGLCLEFFLIASVVAGRSVALWLASALLLVVGTLWFVLPRLGRR